jgi:hypothetical protein
LIHNEIFAGTAEAAEIGAPGIQEPGMNDGLYLYVSAIEDSVLSFIHR